MFSFLGKNPSILKKFLLVNFTVFSVIGLLTILYLLAIEPNLIKKKSSEHVKIINNTINHIERLNIKFEKNEITSFLLSTRFLFQSLDQVQFFDANLNLIGDTDILDLDPRSFSKNYGITELKIDAVEEKLDTDESSINVKESKSTTRIKNIIDKYKLSRNFGKALTVNNEVNNNFFVETIKNVILTMKIWDLLLSLNYQTRLKLLFKKEKILLLERF